MKIFSFILYKIKPLATLLVLPALPYLLLSGTLAAVLGVFVLAIGNVIGWLAWLSATYMLVIINGFANIPSSSFKTGAINPAWIWAYFAALVLILWLSGHRKTAADTLKRMAVSTSKIPVKWIVTPLLVTAMLSTLIAFTMPDTKLHVSFLDVGQGDAILIQTSNHQDILVDGGPSGPGNQRRAKQTPAVLGQDD